MKTAYVPGSLPANGAGAVRVQTFGCRGNEAIRLLEAHHLLPARSCKLICATNSLWDGTAVSALAAPHGTCLPRATESACLLIDVFFVPERSIRLSER